MCLYNVEVTESVYNDKFYLGILATVIPQFPSLL
jgi:hypothetical protein